MSSTTRNDEGNDEAIRAALARHTDDEAHDLGLIVERLAWTPEERLDANGAALSLWRDLRPSGPIALDE
jgi:hypothetical protein